MTAAVFCPFALVATSRQARFAVAAVIAEVAELTEIAVIADASSMAGFLVLRSAF